MTTHEINQLIERYLNGATTPDEERALVLAVQREGGPAEWSVIAEMLGELTADEALYDQIMAQRSPKKSLRRRLRRWSWAAAACVALIWGLSYINIKEQTPATARVEQSHPAHLQPQLHPKPHSSPASPDPAPPDGEAPRQISSARQTLARQNQSFSQPDASLSQPDASLVEVALAESAPVATVQDDAATTDDFALCLALLAEVEARVIMLQQQSTLPQKEEEEKDERQMILDELLANILQQPNRPELSL